MNTGKVILGTLAGLAAGALIGVLFAPDKGSESRRKIVEKGEDYLNSVKEKFNDFLVNIAGKFDGGKADMSDIGETRKAYSKTS